MTIEERHNETCVIESICKNDLMKVIEEFCNSKSPRQRKVIHELIEKINELSVIKRTFYFQGRFKFVKELKAALEDVDENLPIFQCMFQETYPVYFFERYQCRTRDIFIFS